jgi:hypothetical protein
VSQPLQQLIAAYVALCLAFAGAVGMNPTLHHWVEHGGHGPEHTHYGVRGGGLDMAHAHEAGVRHVHAPGRVHAHGQDQPARRPIRQGLFAHSIRAFETPELLNRVGRFIRDVLCGSASPRDSAPDQDGHGHEHHSLAQSLAGGLVETNVDAPLLQANETIVGFVSLPPEALLLADQWDAQSASRAPPAQG